MKPDAPRLLVSVRNVDEANTVSRYPVGILDVKEPNNGALGAADLVTLRQIASVASAEQTISFAAGELAQWTQRANDLTAKSILDFYGQTLSEFGFIKIGLAGMSHSEDWKRDWQTLFHSLPEGCSPVIVSYFDYQQCDAPATEDLIEFASTEPNCNTILFDTNDKTQNLFGFVNQPQLAATVRLAKQKGLSTVVAGSVDHSCLENVIATQPDFIGVRGAVCRGDRNSEIDGRLVNELVDRLQPSSFKE